MIKIIDKHHCCGCSACAQRCPQHCISMTEDKEGFLYPQVDSHKCIGCHLCEQVCPYLHPARPITPIICYAAKNGNESVRLSSSSGGIFTPIAESIIADDGVVYGARFNEKWEVIHAKANTPCQLLGFRKSKYVQSRIGTTYQEIEKFVKTGCKILFSGTPCQIIGLRNFLQKDYENIIFVDFVCHGVPSPMIWREYITTLPLEHVTDIQFKDKSTGWREYSFTLKDDKGNIIFTEPASKNKYLSAFNQNLILRPSCFNCPAKYGRSHSDITLGDFWGIETVYPDMDDNKGVSVILCNTKKGQNLIETISLEKINTELYKYSTIPNNSCFIQSTLEHTSRSVFWTKYNKKGIEALIHFNQSSKLAILRRTIKSILKYIQ